MSITAGKTAPRIWTEAEIEALPDDGYEHEIVDGELVMSPKNSPTEITARLNDFFESRSRLAWVIHPVERFVEICQSPTDREIVNSEGTLEGNDVIPGFSYAIADLFAQWDWA